MIQHDAVPNGEDRFHGLPDLVLVGEIDPLGDDLLHAPAGIRPAPDGCLPGEEVTQASVPGAADSESASNAFSESRWQF